MDAERRILRAAHLAVFNHPAACFALTAWYLVGSPGILPQSDTEAYLWAKKAVFEVAG
jgi:TPR repeat protein